MNLVIIIVNFFVLIFFINIYSHVGNTVGVSTARSTYAQEKLQREAEEANKVLSGNIKNANRTLMREVSSIIMSMK